MSFRIGLVWFDVGASTAVDCANVRSVHYVRGSMICQCLTFLAPHFGVSAWRLKCTKHMGCDSDVVQ
jgi:hypothetical protein